MKYDWYSRYDIANIYLTIKFTTEKEKKLNLLEYWIIFQVIVFGMNWILKYVKGG